MATDPVIISGAGPCGLMCALVLQREGVPFVLLERVEEEKLTSNVGSGLDMTETSMRIFRKLGLPTEHFIRTMHGSTFNRCDGSFLRLVEHISYGTQRSDLQVGLKAALDLKPVNARFGVGVSGFSETESGVTVELTDGSSITGRALLACDGWKSRVRKQMCPDDPVHFCKAQIWWALVKVTPEMKNLASADMTYFLPGSRTRGVFSCGLNASGDHLMWDATLPSEVEPGQSDDLARRGGVRGSAVKEEVQKLFSNRGESVAAMIASTPEENVTKVGLYDFQNLDQPFVSPGGRVALLGDSAHPQTPFLGMGCNMALADAFATCTRLVHQDVRSALRPLDDPEHKSFVKRTVTDARAGISFAEDGCQTSLMTLLLGCAPQGMLKAFVSDTEKYDKGNKELVDRALKECGLPL